MNQDVKKLWVDALRSGDYKQGKRWLRDNDKFCCLGVLCELAVEMGVCGKDYDGSVSLLPTSVSKWSGVKDFHGDKVHIGEYSGRLTLHNDLGKTFEQIADAIEEQL